MGAPWSTHEKIKNGYIISVGKPEWKIPLGTPMHKWKDNLKM